MCRQLAVKNHRNIIDFAKCVSFPLFYVWWYIKYVQYAIHFVSLLDCVHVYSSIGKTFMLAYIHKHLCALIRFACWYSKQIVFILYLGNIYSNRIRTLSSAINTRSMQRTDTRFISDPCATFDLIFNRNEARAQIPNCSNLVEAFVFIRTPRVDVSRKCCWTAWLAPNDWRMHLCKVSARHRRVMGRFVGGRALRWSLSGSIVKLVGEWFDDAARFMFPWALFCRQEARCTCDNNTSPQTIEFWCGDNLNCIEKEDVVGVNS